LRIFVHQKQPLDKHPSPPIIYWKNQIHFVFGHGWVAVLPCIWQPLTPNFLKAFVNSQVKRDGYFSGRVLLAIGFSRLDPHKGFFFAILVMLLR
jgi:hypothetical protein